MYSKLFASVRLFKVATIYLDGILYNSGLCLYSYEFSWVFKADSHISITPNHSSLLMLNIGVKYETCHRKSPLKIGQFKLLLFLRIFKKNINTSYAVPIYILTEIFIIKILF